jgi:hypothetical protein
MRDIPTSKFSHFSKLYLLGHCSVCRSWTPDGVRCAHFSSFSSSKMNQYTVRPQVSAVKDLKQRPINKIKIPALFVAVRCRPRQLFKTSTVYRARQCVPAKIWFAPVKGSEIFCRIPDSRFRDVFIPDPNIFPSRIRIQTFLHSGSYKKQQLFLAIYDFHVHFLVVLLDIRTIEKRIGMKMKDYLTKKMCRIWDPEKIHPGSGYRIHGGVIKKTLNPESATLFVLLPVDLTIAVK